MNAGSVKAIAVLTGEPSPLFPTIKTAKEQGVAGVESYFWTGFFFPKGTPNSIVQKLNNATSTIFGQSANS